MVVIKNTRVIITGGAQGLGFQFCHDLLTHGTKSIAILDIDVKTGEESVKKLNSKYGKGKVIFIPTDVTNMNQLEENFKNAVNQLGGLDIMINNAGIIDDARWALSCDLNVKGVIQGTLLAIDVMGKHKGGNGGTIINMGSIAAFLDEKYIPVYCATKAAVVEFTRCISNNYNEIGVEIKAMCPGASETFLMTNPGQRYLSFLDQDETYKWMVNWPRQKPEELSEAVMRLIEDAPNGAIWMKMHEKPLCEIKLPLLEDMAVPL